MDAQRLEPDDGLHAGHLLVRQPAEDLMPRDAADTRQRLVDSGRVLFSRQGKYWCMSNVLV